MYEFEVHKTVSNNDNTLRDKLLHNFTGNFTVNYSGITDYPIRLVTSNTISRHNMHEYWHKKSI